MRSFRTWVITPWFILVAAIMAAPPLLFSTFMPRWAPMAAVALLAVVGLLRCLAAGRVLGHTPADWPLALILLTLLVGLWASADRDATVPRVYAFIASMGLFWAVAAQTRSGLLRWSGWGMLAAGIALTAVFLMATDFSAAKLPFINREIYSLLPGGFTPFWNSSGFNSNLAGGVLALFLPPALMLAVAGESRLQRLAALVTTVILSAMLLLAQSRGALIAVILILPVMLVMYDRRWLWGCLAIVIAGAACLLMLQGRISLEALLNQQGVGAVSSLEGRVELWSRAIYMIQDFPFTGVGLGMFQPVVKLLYPTFIIAPDIAFDHAHNIYLQTAAEMGIPGLIAHLALYGILGALLVHRSIGHGRGRYRVIALGLLGTLLVYLVHGVTDAVSFYLRTAFIVWSLFGLMVAVSITEGRDETQTVQVGVDGDRE